MANYQLVRNAVSLGDDEIRRRLYSQRMRDETIDGILKGEWFSQGTRNKLVEAIGEFATGRMMINEKGMPVNNIQFTRCDKGVKAHTAKVEEPPVQMKQMDIEDIVEKVIGKRYKGTITITLDIEES